VIKKTTTDFVESGMRHTIDEAKVSVDRIDHEISTCLAHQKVLELIDGNMGNEIFISGCLQH